MKGLGYHFNDPAVYHCCGLAALCLGIFCVTAHQSYVSLNAAATVLLICVLKSAVILACILGGKLLADPLYADADCFLKVINVTNPEHFAQHPLWRELQYNSDCDLQQFSKTVSSFTEQKLFMGVMICFMLYYVVLTGIKFVFNICKQDNPFAELMGHLSLEGVIGKCFSQIVAIELVMLTAATVHFGQDVPFMTVFKLAPLSTQQCLPLPQQCLSHSSFIYSSGYLLLYVVVLSCLVHLVLSRETSCTMPTCP